jgi:hypothetical protein
MIELIKVRIPEFIRRPENISLLRASKSAADKQKKQRLIKQTLAKEI